MSIKIGDLVQVNQSIEEFVLEREKTAGVIVTLLDTTRPNLVEVFWPTGDFETLYEDELEIIK